LPVYSIAAVVGNLLAAGAVILIYVVVLGGRPGKGPREVLAWTQVVLILVAFYGAQAMLRDSANRLEMAAYHVPEWLVYLPPGWLARFVESAGAGPLGARWWILAVSIVGVLVVWAAVVWRLSRAYSRMQPGSPAWGRTSLRPLARPGYLGGTALRWLTRPGLERAAFWLCSTMLRRDYGLRMRLWPMMGTVLAIFALGWFLGQLGNPAAQPGKASTLSLVCLYLLAMPVPAIIHNLQFSREHAAGWALASAPLADPAALAEGLRKAITYRILLPVLVLLMIVFAATWRDPVQVLLHGLVGWLVIQAAGYASLLGAMKRLPFSAPMALGESFGPIAPLVGAVTGAGAFLAVVHYHVISSMPAFAGYLVGLAALVLVLRRIARRVIQRRLVGLSYE
jgi:hypothetical protein